jgi:hypothetical protein
MICETSIFSQESSATSSSAVILRSSGDKTILANSFVHRGRNIKIYTVHSHIFFFVRDSNDSSETDLLRQISKGELLTCLISIFPRQNKGKRAHKEL